MRRSLRRSPVLLLVLLAILVGTLGGCGGAPKSLEALPEAYKSALSTEAGLVEMKPYFLTLRKAYVVADQTRLMTNAEFLLATQADEALWSAWNIVLASVRQKQNPDVAIATMLAALAEFERLVLRFAPDAINTKPAWARR